jgi:glucose/arabinose dehydrogenase
MIRKHLVLPAAALFAIPVAAQQGSTGFAPADLSAAPFEFATAEQGGIRVEVVVDGLSRPFSVALLPNGDALITERGGSLLLAEGAASASRPTRVDTSVVTGAPERGVGRGRGLHELVAHPDFASNSLVYYTVNSPGPDSDGEQTSIINLVRARYSNGALSDTEILFRGEPTSGGSGSRIAFDGNGLLYMTTGAPFSDEAQSLDNVYGKVLRLTEDGDVPAGNPFVDTAGARGEVFTLGHRDQLGLTVHPETGVVLAVEHGPNGGDEVNLILPGRNYGWPEYSFGRTYEGPRHSEVPLGPDTEQPLVLWIPSIGPSGMTVYSGDAFPEWQGNLFVGSARRGEIPGTGGLERIVFNESLEELRRESLLGDLHMRVRDVRQGPDGLLYVLTDDQSGALLRISPL